MCKQLGALTALSEDLISVPCTHVGYSQLPVTSALGDQMPSSDLTYSHRHIHAHKQNKKNEQIINHKKIH